MIPIYQTVRENAQRTHAGDCFRACVASILEMSIDLVPHWFQYQEGGKEMSPAVELAMQDWFNDKGLALVMLPVLAPTPEKAMAIFGIRYSRLHYILVGQTIKGVHHAVVCRGALMVHDPSKPSLGLVGPQKNGFFTICVIALSQWL